MQPATVSTQETIRPWPGFPRLLVAVCVAAISMEGGRAAFAQTTSLLSNGPPVGVVPCVNEPGVPPLTLTPGTATPFPGADGSGGNGLSGAGGTGGGDLGDSDALSTLLGTSWGATAIGNAAALGVNPSALAATCVLKSGCSQPAAGSGAQGVFQMFPAAFQEGLQTALAANPSLASQIVQGSAGRNDPTTGAIAASGYLMQANTALQDAGISNPTVLDARSYYEFGPTYGTQVARANSNATMGSLLPSNFLSNNNIPASETVAQWQASVAAKIGNAAHQTVSS